MKKYYLNAFDVAIVFCGLMAGSIAAQTLHAWCWQVYLVGFLGVIGMLSAGSHDE